MSQDAAGRDFVLYADGTIGPRTATHLRLGVVSKIGNLRPGWSAHEDIDMAYQGDVEVIHNWREEHSIEDLQRLVERKGYSAISVGSFDHAALKKFPYQLTAGHCEPSPGYSNTLYIWNGRGGGGGSGADDESGALGIISSVEPTKSVNKRHMTPEQRAAARRGAGFSFADHPALSAVAALVGALAAAYGCATMRRADEAPKENPCCGGKYKEAQA